MNIKSRQLMALMLSIVGAGGTIATGILTRNAAKKEVKDYDGLLPFKKGNFKDILNVYKLPITIGAITVASVVTSTIMSRKAEASLLSMAVIADQGWRKYKYEVQSLLGKDKHVDVLKGIAKNDSLFIDDNIEETDDRKLYFEEHLGFFLANPEKLALAYSDMNQRLEFPKPKQSYYYTMINDLIEDSEAEILDKSLNLEAFQWGWSREYLEEIYNYRWVHMTTHETENEVGRKFIVIEWGEEPILNPGNYGEELIKMYSDYPEEDTPGEFMTVLDK